MKLWNLLVTVRPGPQHVQRVLDALRRHGEFHRTSFRDVCIGRVDDIESLLEAVHDAIAAGKAWTQAIGRVVPVEATFPFTPGTLTESLKAAAAPLAARLADGTFCVRVERRGLAGAVDSAKLERAVAEHFIALAQASGRKLVVSLEDPDFLLAAETIGTECGVGLITRELRRRFPFVQVR